jgi:hypothetical protein
MELKEQLKKLIKLQNIDSEIYDCESQIEVFPEKIGEIDNIINSKTEKVNNAEEELKKLQVLKNDKETDIKAKEEKIAKHESELYQIKNNKEYKALQQEIESIKADISLLEEELITLFDDIESAQKTIESEKKFFENEKDKLEKKKSGIKQEEKDLGAKIKDLQSKREQAAVDIPPEILQKYNRILGYRGRTAVAKLNGDSCGGCNMQLPPQVINEVKLQKNIIQCENCSRILYAEE